MTNVDRVVSMFVFSRALRLGFTANVKAFFGITCLLAAPALFAQTATKPEEVEQKEADKKIVELTKFSVTTTQDHGFVVNNSAGAFRTNQALLDIPQVDVVVTRDMLDAIRSADSSDVMRYFGMVPTTEGEQAVSRGNTMLPFQDDMPTGGVPFADNGIIDNYEIIKGPAQVLYLSNSLSGILLKNTKKPLPYKRDVIQASIDSNGSIGGMLDFTGPLGKIGDANISYRLVAVHRDDGEVFVNLRHKADIIMPQFQVDFKNTTIRAYLERAVLLRSPNQSALLQPDGKLSIPPTGFKHADRLTKNSMQDFTLNMGFISIDTKMSDNWDNRFKGSFRHSKWLGTNPLALYTNWDTRQVGYITRKLDLPASATVVMDDVQGHYDVGPTSNVDSFGFILSDQTYWNSIWGAPTLPANSVWKNTVFLPIDDTQNLIESDKYAAPPLSDYDGSKVDNKQSRQTTKNTLLYYAHSINITKYLTLSAGISWAQVENTGIVNTRVRPYVTTTPTLQSNKLHRYGAVFKPTKDISFYALESTTFNAAAGGGQVLQDGTFPPNPEGKDREIGFKTAMFDGKLTANFAMYDMNITGNVKLGGINPDGSIYYVKVPGNSEESKGYDANIGLSVIPGLQVLGTYTHTDHAFYTKFPQSTWSIFADYKFPRNSPLAGLSIGGGTSHANGTYVALSGTYTYSGETDLEKSTGLKLIKDTGTPVKVYAAYAYKDYWNFRLSIDNLLDQVYPFGGIGGLHTVLDVGLPRTVSFDATYRF